MIQLLTPVETGSRIIGSLPGGTILRFGLISAFAGLPFGFLQAQDVVISGDTQPSPATSPSWFIPGNLGVGVSDTGTLDIRGTGFVSNEEGFIGALSGSAGFVTIEDEGIWINNQGVQVGSRGFGSLMINDEGFVSNETGSIGTFFGSDGVAAVTGLGLWTNSEGFFVGGAGNGTLLITDFGSVSNTFGQIGSSVGSSGFVSIERDGIWTNLERLEVGGEGDGALAISGSGSVNSLKGYVGSSAGSEGTVVISDNAVWTNSGELEIGSEGVGALVISGFGSVSNTTGYIGTFSGSNGSVTLEDDATWENSENLQVGSGGDGDLIISGTGIVSNTNGFIGSFPGSEGSVKVGDDAKWMNSGELEIGGEGVGSLSIENSGSVSNSTGLIGAFSGSIGSVTLGDEAVWTSSKRLEVASEGVGELAINGSASVSNSAGYIGRFSGSEGAVTVSDNGEWINSGTLVVGGSGEGSLEIKDSGMVSSKFGRIGSDTGSTGSVTVAGGTWTNSEELNVGQSGTGTLEIRGTGIVSNTGAFIGEEVGSSGVVTVSENGTWLNSEDLVMGVGGSGTLNIRDTGFVSSASGIIGILGSGEVVVRDGTWTSSSQIQIGASSSGTLDISGTGTVTSASNVIGGREGSTGELSISDSGTMSGGFGGIGFESGATGSVRISDQATLANSGTFTVGVGGSGTLAIVNSGKLSNTTGFIGLNAGSGGTVVIADNASWTNSEILLVGVEGSGELDISGSAEVSSLEGSLGRYVGGKGIARISGGTWTNQERLRVGRNGTGLLEISGTGHVISPVVEVAFDESATGTIMLNGGMLSVEQMTEEGGTGGGSVRFNGGTLQLMADQPDLFANFEAGDVTFGTGGGIIDTQPFDVATSLPLQGPGGLTKTGTGNLLLSGASTYTGSTDIRQGNLFVNGSLDATDTFVRDTARLGGGGRLGGNLTVERGGFLSPGNSTGILTVGGNLMLGSGSITQMEINGTVPGTQHDQIIVGGTATVDGVLELYFGGGLANGDSFTLIETNNPIAGEFDSVVNVLGNALTFETALTDGAILTITATQSDFTPFALTSNQQAVAQAIDDESLTGKVNDVVNVLNTLPGSSLPGAFDEIAPASLAFIPSTAFANSRFHLRNLSNHMRQRRDSIRPKTATSPEVRKQMVSFGGAQPGSDESRWGLFTSGNFDRIDGDSNGSGYDSEAFGPTVGVDYQLTECFLLGFHVGYDNTDLEFGNNAGDVQGDSVTFGLYGTWFHEGGSWVEGILGGGHHSYDTTRSVLGAEATGDTSSSEFLVSLASGYDYRFGRGNEWLFTPSLGLAYNRLATDGFTESGSVAPLAFRDQTAESLNGNLDLRLRYEREWNGIKWQPYGTIGWRHEFLERSQAIGARFATGTQIFTVNGPRSPRDSVTFGAGINAILNESLGIGLDYRGEANSSFRVHQIGASLKFEF